MNFNSSTAHWIGFLSGFRVRFLLNSMRHGQFTMTLEHICPLYRSISRYHAVFVHLRAYFFGKIDPFWRIFWNASNACEYWPDMIPVWINLGHIRWTNDFYLSWIIDQNWPFSQSRFLVRWDFRLVWTNDDDPGLTQLSFDPSHSPGHVTTSGHVICPTHPPDIYCSDTVSVHS